MLLKKHVNHSSRSAKSRQSLDASTNPSLDAYHAHAALITRSSNPCEGEVVLNPLEAPKTPSPKRPLGNRLRLLAVSLATAVLASSAYISPAYAVPDYPVGEQIYRDKDEIPHNGVAYNVAEMLRPYSQEAGPSVRLNKGIANTLTVSKADAVADQVLITDTNTFKLSVDPSKWNGFIPSTAEYTYTHSTQYIDGTTKTFTQTNQIAITPKVDGLTATPYYYRTQMSGDRWIYRNGTLEQVNIQPNSFTADIVHAQGWEIRRTDGSPAQHGIDY